MSIVTFWNSSKQQAGQTMSIAAIATYMAIEHNYKILVISTTDREDSFRRCFWEEKKGKKNLGIFGPNASLEIENGVEGLVRVIRSNKITPEVITNYTKVVFKDRLEFLLGSESRIKGENSTDNIDIKSVYPDIISMANQYYDIVLVDLDENIGEETKKTILHQSDILVVNIGQRLRDVEKFYELRQKTSMYNSKKTILMIGRYDKFSKYNAKNISRYLGEKNKIQTIPYNTLFFEASEEAGVTDLFLRFKKNLDSEDRNAFFIEEVKRATENIIYRLQDLQMKV